MPAYTVKTVITNVKSNETQKWYLLDVIFSSLNSSQPSNWATFDLRIANTRQDATTKVTIDIWKWNH